MRLLLHEDHFVLIIAQAGEVAVVSPVKELVTLIGTLGGQELALVIAIEMDLEGLAASVVALEKLGLDVRGAGCCNQGWYPVLGGEYVIELYARLNDSPASAPLPVRSSCLPSWCSSRRGTAWRPRRAN